MDATTTTWALHLHRVLGHTMLLVSAITIACKRTTSQLHSQMYLQCMVPYISQLVDIHPHETVWPYHHMSMHLPHFFSLFGPAWTLWTYPFEQLIGQIQRLLSNHKLGKLSQIISLCIIWSIIHWLGQMESTLLTSLLKASKIKQWMADPSNPALVQQIKSLDNNIYSPNSPDGVSTAHADELEESDDTQALLSAKKIPIDLRPLLPSPETKICLHARFKQGGIVFSIPQIHEGNSQVYFYPNGDRLASPIPGIIRHILANALSSSPFNVPIWLIAWCQILSQSTVIGLLGYSNHT